MVNSCDENSKENTNKVVFKRDLSIDFISGLLVIYMIYTHISQFALQSDSYLYRLLDSLLYFFMPWFYFKAGMFYKHGGQKRIIIQKLNKRLLMPLLIFSAINIPLFCIPIFGSDKPFFQEFVRSFFEYLIIQGSPFGNDPLWFLISLIILRYMFLLLKSAKMYIPISFFLMVVSFFLWRYHIGPIRFFFPSLLGFFFFSSGYYLKKQQYNRFLFILSFLIFVFLFVFCPYHISVRSNEIYIYGHGSTYWGGYFVSLLSCLSGIVVLNNFGKFLSYNHFLLSKLREFFCIVGKDSLYYYVIHWIYLLFWSYTLHLLNLNILFLYLLVPTTLFLSKKMHLLDSYTTA